jgi:hypothetical protein
MPEPHDLPLTAALEPESAAQSLVAQDSAHKGAFEWSLLAIFALLLAFVTARHELWSDELQAWLIARDNHSLFDLFRSLRYEGHPALWYLVLYIPAHISWNPLSMQVINYLFAVAEAWLVLSTRKLHWPVRLLATFSFFIFYNYGAIPRSYMLTMLLLTAAVRCLLGERQHRKLAILFLALSINTHILAVPIAATIALWAFCLPKIGGWKDIGKLIWDAEIRVVALVLLASLAMAYFTVRPPADITVPLLPAGHHSLAYNILLAEGRTWKAFLPASSSYMPTTLRELLDPADHLSLLASALSFALFLGIAAALRTSQARCFFAAAWILELIALAATVVDPYLRHLGLCFTILLLALMIDAYAASGKPVRARFPQLLSSCLILSILAFQTAVAIFATVSAGTHPYSEAKDVAIWLKQQGLDKNPIVLDGFYPLAVVGYLERPSAYLTSCRCFGSFAVWSTKSDFGRSASLDDIRIARGASPLPVILLHSDKKLDQADAQKLGLVEIRSFGANRTASHGSYTVYEQEKP